MKKKKCKHEWRIINFNFDKVKDKNIIITATFYCVHCLEIISIGVK